MSELRSVIEALRAEVLTSLPDAHLEEDFTELQAACHALELERVRRLAEIDRRRSFERDGFLSTAAWLAGRHLVAWGEARRDIALARAIGHMPRARRAFEDGAVSLSAVRVLAEAAEAEPDAFQVAETFLVEVASSHSIADLRRAVIHWRHVVERERAGIDGLDVVLRARRRLHASVTLEGMVRLDGDLDPETGETFMTALRAVLDAEARSATSAGGDRDETDDRSPAQRRADALGEICRGWLDRADRPEVAGERPHLTVTVPLGALSGRAGSQTAGDGSGMDLPARPSGELTSERLHTGTVDHQDVRRLACDASITRIVLDRRSEPIDVGRKTPVVSPAIRRAVVARDRHCRFPGCDRPQSWCDAHHVIHWADGGETSLGNLVLLCRRHHRLTHERFSVEMIDGRPLFRRSDGGVLEDGVGRAPP